MTKIIYLFTLFFLFSCDNNSNIQNDAYYFNLVIEETGESTLFIFQNTIDIEIGCEIGLFDLNGVIDSNGTIGEVLVGSGMWTGEQLEIVTVGSIDLTVFGGPILPGYVEGNSMILKLWNGELNSNITFTIVESGGSGLFNGLFTTIDSIVIN